MIENSHLDQPQCFLEPLSNTPVGITGFWISRGMIVDQDHGGGVMSQGLLYDLSRVDAGRVDGAAEQLLEADHAVLAVEKYGTEHLVLVVLQQDLQVLER